MARASEIPANESSQEYVDSLSAIIAKGKQSAAFIEAAIALECDESEERFNEALGKIVRQKPKPDMPTEKQEAPDEKEPAK